MSTPSYFLAHKPSLQENEMHNALCREGMYLAQTLNINPYQYKFATNLREEFIMPKYVARVSLPKKKVHLITKVLFANLIYSAFEKEGHMRLLTSIRKLSQHFNMSTNQMYYQLSLLQSIKVEGTPVIVCIPYDVPLPKKDQVKCTLTQKTEQTKTHINITQDYTNQLKEKEQKRTILRRMKFDAWEQPIEIIVLAHAHFRYDRTREKDFFFSVNTTWEVSKLSLVERYYLFYIQTNIYQNRLKKRGVHSTLYLNTYAECFGVGINYSRKILQSLEAQGYIKMQIENQKTRVELLPKGTRKIDWFEKQLALTKN